jgi:NhaA family Na+:H+ antiporter
MSAPTQDIARLDRAVDPERDHVPGPAAAPMTLVEYGSYACPHCRVANERIGGVRTEFGDRLRYVFRHRPLTGNDLARRAAELAEMAPTPERFWDAHVALMSRSASLTEEDLGAVAEELGLGDPACCCCSRRSSCCCSRICPWARRSRRSDIPTRA